MGNSLQKSSKSETPSVAIRFRTECDIDKPETRVQLNLIGNLWLTYKCMKQTIKSLQEAFGWKGHNITDFNEPILVGKTCNIVCQEEEYQGDVRWSVVFMNRPGGLKKMQEKELAALVADIQPMVDEMMGERAEINRGEEVMPGAIGYPDGEEKSERGGTGTMIPAEEDEIPF